MFEKIKPAAALFIITVFFALALGAVYNITYEPIEAQKAKNEAETVNRLVPGTEETRSEDVEVPESSVCKVISCYAKGEIIGYAIVAAPKGYGGSIEIMAGFDVNGVILGVNVLSHSETPGLGAKAVLSVFLDQYKGVGGQRFVVTKLKRNAPNEIEAITSATITTEAVTKGVNDALSYFEVHYGNH